MACTHGVGAFDGTDADQTRAGVGVQGALQVLGGVTHRIPAVRRIPVTQPA